ncbi:MAG TPA: argininosuccinate lyase [Burkholderiales bacterium]|nr:argininosuccinate lyase [Burkholderiales bacterium]
MKEAMTWPLLQQEANRFKYFCWIDQAHTVMLCETGIIKIEPARLLLRALRELESEGVATLQLDPQFGSYLFQVERWLAKRIGEDAAGRMHTARGRADYGSASLALAARSTIVELYHWVIELQRGIVELAKSHTKTLMPGYTHLQHAQPTTFGHYILSHYYPLKRDLERLQGLYARTNVSTLGSCSRVGTNWPIDRYRVAELLGHDSLVMNAQDQCYYRRDHLSEYAAVTSIMAHNLARLATDIDIWHSEEFDMFELPAEYCGSSSIMPQKRNPEPLERCRAVAGESIGWMPAALGIFKLPHTSVADPSYSVVSEGRLFDDVSMSLSSMVRLCAEALPKTVIKKDRMDALARGRWNIASRLGDIIAQETGMPFGDSHVIVGGLVRHCIDNGIPPSKVTSAILDEVALRAVGRPLGFEEELVANAMDAMEFVNALKGPGSANPDVVREAAAEAESQIEDDMAWLIGARSKEQAARNKLNDAIDAILSEARSS